MYVRVFCSFVCLKALFVVLMIARQEKWTGFFEYRVSIYTAGVVGTDSFRSVTRLSRWQKLFETGEKSLK